MSKEFQDLLGGVRTRQLAKLVADRVQDPKAKARAEEIFVLCGIKPKKAKKAADEETAEAERSKGVVYTTWEAIGQMAKLLQQDGGGKTNDELARAFAKLIAASVYVPDMALSGRMLEPDSSAAKVWDGMQKNVEAALQVAHAISTHEARPETDYYVAKDDIPGADQGAGFIDEAMFGSACFYKYFSINWDVLVKNLKGHDKLAAHTVGAFIRGAALATPSGKQNSYAAHNCPDGVLIEVKDSAPTSYANAFVKPATQGGRDLVSQSIAQFGQYVHDMDVGYGDPLKPPQRLWFSPNHRYDLQYQVKENDKVREEHVVADKGHRIGELSGLVEGTVKAIGFDWQEVRKVILGKE